MDSFIDQVLNGSTKLHIYLEHCIGFKTKNE